MSPTGLQALAPCRQDPVLQSLGSPVRVYCVGGAVRDVVMGEAALDRDYLVTGATPEQMTQAGFRPVGRDFPVFLHPVTHAEYALARTERKSGQGYKGFTFFTGPEVSLAEDLQRRDLRVNAMAVDVDGVLHDPTGGLQDIAQRRLSHVSPAFREDPLRLLRLARFAARWPHFEIAEETLTLCREIVSAGELASLVAERIWTEIDKGLLARSPSRMMRVLDGLGAWTSLVGEDPGELAVPGELPVPGEPDLPRLPPLEALEGLGLPIPVLAAVLLHQRPIGRLASVLPRPVQEWRMLLSQGLATPVWGPSVIPPAAGLPPAGLPPANLHQELPSGAGFAASLLDWAERADLFRRPDRTEPLLQLLWAQDPGAGPEPTIRGALQSLIQSLLSLPVGSTAKAAAEAKLSIPESVRGFRLGWLCERLNRA